MPKIKWDGAEDPKLITSIKWITENVEYALLSADRPKPTAVFHINRSSQKYSSATSILGDTYGPPAETHAEWNN